MVQQSVEELALKLKESEEQQVEALERLEQEKRELQACLQEQHDIHQNRTNICNSDVFNDSKAKMDLDHTVDLPDAELILKKIEDLPEITSKEASQFTEEVEKLRQRLDTMEEDLQKSQQVVDDLIGIYSCLYSVVFCSNSFCPSEQLKNAQMEIDLRDEVVNDLQDRIQQVQLDLDDKMSNDVKLNKVLIRYFVSRAEVLIFFI